HCVLANGKYQLVTFEGRQASVRDVARVVPHPQFSLQTGEFQDLALVKLAASPPPNLRPAPLSDRRAPASFGDRFIVAGFGVATKGQTKSAGTLRMAALVATDRPSSQQLTLVDPKKLGEAPGLGVCNGDSGGPVFDERNLTLVGIISWSGPHAGSSAASSRSSATAIGSRTPPTCSVRASSLEGAAGSRICTARVCVVTPPGRARLAQGRARLPSPGRAMGVPP